MRLSNERVSCRPFRLYLTLIVLLLLQACSAGDVPRIPPQHWQDVEIAVETRPLQVRPGMNEFLVIATNARGLPAHDMVVSLRMDQADPWSQTIQDGHSGVFRRAINVKVGQENVFVQLRREVEEITLEYSLKPVL